MSPWFALAAMSLATFILTKLIVDLDFPPVMWLRDRVVGGFRPLTLAEQAQLNRPRATLGVSDGEIREIDGERYIWRTRNKRIPYFFAELMSCPWCVSAYAAAVTVAGTWLFVGLPVPILMWFATWSLGALLVQHDWS